MAISPRFAVQTIRGILSQEFVLPFLPQTCPLISPKVHSLSNYRTPFALITENYYVIRLHCTCMSESELYTRKNV